MAFNIEKRLMALEEKAEKMENPVFLIVSGLSDLTEEQERACPKYKAAKEDRRHRLHLVIYDCGSCDFEGECSMKSCPQEEAGQVATS